MGSPSVCSHQATGGELYSGIAQSCARLTGQTSGLPQILSYASDLNPVAVLINKAMIEIPPKFAGRKPVGPIPKGEKQATLHEDWSGAKGLAEDVRRYGQWMREEAQKCIGHLYPPAKITDEMAQEVRT
jgi:adenine-specific DNA methylase